MMAATGHRRKRPIYWRRWIGVVVAMAGALTAAFYLYNMHVDTSVVKHAYDLSLERKSAILTSTSPTTESLTISNKDVIPFPIQKSVPVQLSAASSSGPYNGVTHNKEAEEDEVEVATTELQSDQQRINANAEQLNVFDRVLHSLSQHALQQLNFSQIRNFSFEDYFVQVKADPRCSKLPLFVSMANVFSDLYWQLLVSFALVKLSSVADSNVFLFWLRRIENFIYTMVKFDLSACAVMICVSDNHCMERCKQSLFPCIDFQYSDFHPVSKSFAIHIAVLIICILFQEKSKLPHTLEQIAELKLYHIPKVLSRGVDVIMLDLDVGFLSDPRRLLEGTRPRFDVYVQVSKSIIFSFLRVYHVVDVSLLNILRKILRML